MNLVSKKILLLIFIAATLTITVQAGKFNYIDVWFADSDYSETVEAGGTLEVEVSVGYNFTPPARLNIWVYDGFWYHYETKIVTDVFIDITEEGPETITLHFPAPEEPGEYIFQTEASWCDSGSTELNAILGTKSRLNITFTVTPSATGGTDMPVGIDTPVEDNNTAPTNTVPDETKQTGGIPGFQLSTILQGLVLAVTLMAVKTRNQHQSDVLI